jgi:NAD(P)-dependent dehydrogenase (short-subunit alcohol dehydrogenase family)
VTLALVTGAGRGLGLEICRQLADRDVDVLLCARSQEAADAAARSLWDEGLDSVHPRVVDVTSDASVLRLRERVEREFGALDVLMNNAGIFPDRDMRALEPDLDVVRRVAEVNLYGALRMTSAFAPLLRAGEHGRVVNVSSGMGSLARMGAGAPAYRLSKAGLNAATRMLAAELEADGVLVNAATPGHARSDMGGPDAPRSLAEGADTLVWLATLPDDGPTGGFFRDRRPIDP